MVLKLHELADIKTGITFRNRLFDNLEGEVEVIQMKDVNADHTISDRLVRVSAEAIKPKHILLPGQIILLAKGKYTSASLITASEKKRVISSAFFSIKIKHVSLIQPAYLQWFLNHAEAQHFFTANASGTSMFSLPMSVLRNLPVPVPSLAVQEKVVRTVQLRQREHDTLIRLEAEKDQYIQRVLTRHIYA